MESKDNKIESEEQSKNTQNLGEKVSKINEKIKEKFKKNAEEKVKELENKIKGLETKLSIAEDEKLRALAEFQNFRNRKEIELIESRDRAIVNFILEILPSIDNFEMSLKMTENHDMFVKGVEMIHKNLIDSLKQHRIEEFEPGIGEDFNPEKHDPILIDDENAEPGKIINTIKKGYKHKDKIIRPARVQVKKDNIE